jgi:hypothetical protein
LGLDERVDGGAGTDSHDRPASPVRNSARHRLDDEHGAVPSTHPICDETKVTDTGTKPAGTATPAGVDNAGAVAAGDALGVGVADAAAELVGLADRAGEEPQAQTRTARPVTAAAVVRPLLEAIAQT